MPDKDGKSLVGRKNAYTCKSCKRHIMTIDRDEGVTPFMIPCEFGCKEMMESNFYRVPQYPPASHEWRKPETLEGLSPGYRQHVERGGLLLFEIDPPHTAVLLAKELDKAGLREMSDKARFGYYHDFLSPLATPCIQLAEDLAAAATPAALALRARHLNGDFDANNAESDEWFDLEGAELMATMVQELSDSKKGKPQ